ncbi:hypothetical protein ACFOPN_19220 [Xanthomonas hyacinthi]|uniref:hypothetical protein n=1 Tax=Xanthomonas hyacinthi TaxID=56455 RepID=UPI00360E7713
MREHRPEGEGRLFCHWRRPLLWSRSTRTAPGFICRQAQASAIGAGRSRGCDRRGQRYASSAGRRERLPSAPAAAAVAATSGGAQSSSCGMFGNSSRSA